MKSYKIKYRPEIDSLRAIVVVAVIIYHAKINFLGFQIFRGGYLGVDIFFVISGYLITLIIFRELQQKKSFSFRNFYLRRARRIVPALFFLILFGISPKNCFSNSSAVRLTPPSPNILYINYKIFYNKNYL